MGFEHEMDRGARSRPAPRPATLDGLIAALQRLETLSLELARDRESVARDDLPAFLQSWLRAQPGRSVERDEGGGVAIVRCGRGMRQTSQQFRTANAAATALAQNTVFWINEPGDTRRWRGPAKRKDRARDDLPRPNAAEASPK